jgi:hypothetical protein
VVSTVSAAPAAPYSAAGCCKASKNSGGDKGSTILHALRSRRSNAASVHPENPDLHPQPETDRDPESSDMSSGDGSGAKPSPLKKGVISSTVDAGRQQLRRLVSAGGGSQTARTASVDADIVAEAAAVAAAAKPPSSPLSARRRQNYAAMSSQPSIVGKTTTTTKLGPNSVPTLESSTTIAVGKDMYTIGKERILSVASGARRQCILTLFDLTEPCTCSLLRCKGSRLKNTGAYWHWKTKMNVPLASSVFAKSVFPSLRSNRLLIIPQS